jgi:uncharacterized protein
LKTFLGEFERTKGSQVAVLIVPTTQPESIEQYAIRVADQWKLGRTGVDDGVLFLVAKDDRTLRFEVGYGLEGVLPDALCNQIINGFALPRFKEGDFFGGIRDGVSRILGTIQGEPLPPPPRQKKTSGGVIVWIFIFLLFSLIFSRVFLDSRPLVRDGGAGVPVEGDLAGVVLGAADLVGAGAVLVEEERRGDGKKKRS